MAIYRTVQMAFWTDPSLIDEFTPEDKYFYLYLLTNPQTTLCGCYQIAYKSVEDHTGYTKDTINRLLERFQNVHHLIEFNKENKEVYLLNWHKYNWTTSSKFLIALNKSIEGVKTKSFKEDLINKAKSIANLSWDTVSIPYTDGTDTSVTDIYKDLNSNDSSKDLNKDLINDIVTYLNDKLGTHYRSSSANTVKHINARISEGYSLEDFKTVIDKKSDEWQGTDMEKYLVPETLFGTKFEKYLNQTIIKKSDMPSTFGGYKWEEI